METNELMLEKAIIPTEDVSLKDTSVVEELPKNSKTNRRGNRLKTKECKVIAFHEHDNTLDVKFDDYGIRIKGVKSFHGDTAVIKYKGNIGRPNFEYTL